MERIYSLHVQTFNNKLVWALEMCEQTNNNFMSHIKDQYV